MLKIEKGKKIREQKLTRTRWGNGKRMVGILKCEGSIDRSIDSNAKRAEGFLPPFFMVKTRSQRRSRKERIAICGVSWPARAECVCARAIN